MAAVRFCSECGDRLKVRASSLPFRSFCARCSPRLKQARLMLTAGAALCAAIGFAAGHFTAEREPFYYIGTPVELSANNTAPSLNHAHSSQQIEPSLQPEQPVIGPAAAEGICGARTKSGKPCHRKVKGGGYCWQHREKLGERKPAGPLP